MTPVGSHSGSLHFPKVVRSLLMLTLTLGSLSSGLSFGLSAAPAMAQTSSPNPVPGRPNRPRGEWLKQLNLTPEQTRRVEEIRSRNQSQMQQLRGNLRQARQELSQLMDGNASQRQIQDKFAQVQSIQQDLGRLRFENMLAIREVLNPEQRQQLRTLMQERRQRGQGQWQRRPGGKEF